MRKLLLGITLAAAALAGACQGADIDDCLMAQIRLTEAESRPCPTSGSTAQWQCENARREDINEARHAIATECR